MPEQIPLMVDAVTQELRQFASDETIPQGQLLAALQVALTGLVTSDVSGVLESDTILQALGKLQAQTSNKVDKVAGKQLSTEDYTSAEKEKLSGIATGATANASDADLRDRATHTGTQPITTITGVVGAMAGGAIIERGSNANGEYVKFADGTQICTGNLVYANITTSVSAGVFMSSAVGVAFAAAFTNIPYCSVGLTGSSMDAASWAATYNITSNGADTFCFCPVPSANPRYASFLAVGRWK